MGNMQEARIALPSAGKLFTPGVTALLALMVAGFLGFLIAPNAVVDMLGLNPPGVVRGRIWQLVTYPFVNGAMGLVGNGLVLLFIGSAIEREWRTAALLWLWLVVSVGCGILWVAINLATGGYTVGLGAAACDYGLIATLGLLFRDRQFFALFTALKAQHLAIGLIVIGIILSLPVPINLVWVAGAAVGYVYVKACWSLNTRRLARPSDARRGGTGQFVDID
jgi:membrane associated rhomboid family serine protease